MPNMFNGNMNSKTDTNIYLVAIIVLGVALCYLQPWFIPVVVLVLAIT